MQLADRTTALVEWYSRSHRRLPWRTTTDPYRILVSEVMLQQTQAERVAPRYKRFLMRFPTEDALADATLAEVLDEWSGLGYNSRAKRLREAAAVVAVDGWPATAAGLQTLPGVGPYTAAAVASFAFGEPTAVVDTNVRRVLSRWHGTPLDGDRLATAANEALEGDAATWNQAIMELGATLCRPRNPSCGACPVTKWCRDPQVYEPPPRQSRFEGSRRQVRGAVIRILRDGPATAAQLRSKAPATHEIDGVLAILEREGLVERRGDQWALPGLEA